MRHLIAKPAEEPQELEALLDEALCRLPDKYRLPLILCELEGRPRKDVARQLNLPEGTLSSRLATGRKLLAKRLARHRTSLSAGAIIAGLSGSAASASVHGSLAASTSKAAALWASDQATPGLVSPTVAALTQGVLKGMFLARLIKTAAVLLLMAGLLGGLGAGMAQSILSDRSGPRTEAPAEQPDRPRPVQPDRQPDPTKPPRGIDAKTVEAYAKIGGTYGAMGTVENPWFLQGQQYAERGVPGFMFYEVPRDKLPQVAVPFGLDFKEKALPELVQKELGGLQNLVALSLMGTMAGIDAGTGRRLFGDGGDLSQPQCSVLTDSGLKELARLEHFTTLLLSGQRINDGGLKRLAVLQDLRELSLQYSEVTDAGLKELAPLKKLTALHLWHTAVTDAGLKELAVLKNLSLLNVGEGRTTNTGLKVLAGFEKLTALNLTNARVNDTGMEDLVALENLTSLGLRGTQVGDAGLKRLAGLKKLAALELGGTKVTEAGLKELAVFKNLNSLDLGRPPKVTDPTLKLLCDIGKLHALVQAAGKDAARPRSAAEVVAFDLDPLWVTAQGLKALAGLENLVSLRMNPSQITDESLRVLREIGLLHALARASGKDKARPRSAAEVLVLDLSSSSVTDAGLKELAACKNLATLYLNFTKVGDAELKTVVGLKTLTKLGLNNTRVTDAGLKDLANLKNLTTLGLASLPVTDAGLKVLAPLERLATLDLCFTRVTDAGLKELMGFKNLKVLFLNGSRVTAAAAAELRKTLPNCNIGH